MPFHTDTRRRLRALRYAAADMLLSLIDFVSPEARSRHTLISSLPPLRATFSMNYTAYAQKRRIGIDIYQR